MHMYISFLDIKRERALQVNDTISSSTTKSPVVIVETNKDFEDGILARTHDDDCMYLES